MSNDSNVVMAFSAILAFACCLALIIPARIIAKFLAELFGKSSTNLMQSQPRDSERIIGCVESKRRGRSGELQLWIHEEKGLYHFALYQQFSVRHVTGSTLETSKPQASYQLTLEQGQAAMARWLKS